MAKFGAETNSESCELQAKLEVLPTLPQGVLIGYKSTVSRSPRCDRTAWCRRKT